MEIMSLIDHTLLKADATGQQIRQLCAEAKQYGFASVCVNPIWVSLANSELRGSDVKVCTVVGFPLGASSMEIKISEAENAVANGAHEIDMVISVGKLKDRDYGYVQEEISQVVRVVGPSTVVKVIIETCLLTDEEKCLLCSIIKEAGAHFVKTSTGFSGGGATIRDIKLLKSICGDHIGIKASGGISSLTDAMELVTAGATRLGLSRSIQIVEELVGEPSSILKE